MNTQSWWKCSSKLLLLSLIVLMSVSFEKENTMPSDERVKQPQKKAVRNDLAMRGRGAGATLTQDKPTTQPSKPDWQDAYANRWGSGEAGGGGEQKSVWENMANQYRIKAQGLGTPSGIGGGNAPVANFNTQENLNRQRQTYNQNQMEENAAMRGRGYVGSPLLGGRGSGGIDLARRNMGSVGTNPANPNAPVNLPAWLNPGRNVDNNVYNNLYNPSIPTGSFIAGDGQFVLGPDQNVIDLYAGPSTRLEEYTYKKPTPPRLPTIPPPTGGGYGGYGGGGGGGGGGFGTRYGWDNGNNNYQPAWNPDMGLFQLNWKG